MTPKHYLRVTVISGTLHVALKNPSVAVLYRTESSWDGGRDQVRSDEGRMQG